jgi:hypothetical protein
MNNLFWSLLLMWAAVAPAAAQQAITKVKVKTKGSRTQAASLALPPPPAAPELVSTYAASIRQADLREHLTVLASDGFQGREVGQPGQKKAAAYLVQQFQALGLQGPMVGSAEPYVQPFALARSAWAPGGYLTVQGHRYEWLRDFFSYGPQPSPFPVLMSGQPVFAGFGIEEAGYSDYANLDVRGKDVLVLMGEPQDPRGHSLLGGGRVGGNASSSWTSGVRKVRVAQRRGARSVFLLTFAPAATFQRQAAQIAPLLREPILSLPNPGPEVLDSLRDDVPAGIGVYFVSQDMGLDMAGTDLAGLTAYAQQIAEAGRPVRVPFQVPPFSIQLPEARQELATENVLGYLEGTDKKDEVLVISAHYDHLGVKHDTIYNGADDDGSGTVAVLALAKAFTQAKQEGHGPRRSILFMANTAEEEGLFGSQFYTGHPVFKLENTVADLNIDMVGRTDKKHRKTPAFVYVIGADKLSSELNTINEAANQRYAHLLLDYSYNKPNDPEQLYYRSDHYNFAKHRVPVIFYTAGLHPDYHKATDDVDKIEFGPLEQRARLIFYTAWELANREKRIVVDSDKP